MFNNFPLAKGKPLFRHHLELEVLF